MELVDALRFAREESRRKFHTSLPRAADNDDMASESVNAGASHQKTVFRRVDVHSLVYVRLGHRVEGDGFSEIDVFPDQEDILRSALDKVGEGLPRNDEVSIDMVVYKRRA